MLRNASYWLSYRTPLTVDLRKKTRLRLAGMVRHSIQFAKLHPLRVVIQKFQLQCLIFMVKRHRRCQRQSGNGYGSRGHGHPLRYCQIETRKALLVVSTIEVVQGTAGPLSGCEDRPVVVFELYVPYGWLQARPQATTPRQTLAAKTIRLTSVPRCDRADILTYKTWTGSFSKFHIDQYSTFAVTLSPSVS